jgi:hypothetical protein
MSTLYAVVYSKYIGSRIFSPSSLRLCHPVALDPLDIWGLLHCAYCIGREVNTVECQLLRTIKQAQRALGTLHKAWGRALAVISGDDPSALVSGVLMRPVEESVQYST